MVIGIDASNLNQGGGVTHLVEILSSLDVCQHNISKVIIWGGGQTLDEVGKYQWLVKSTPKELNRGLIFRLLWQKFKLSKCAIDDKCDLVYSPGGSVSCNFKPIVTMSRNMLPFEWSEARRYGFSWITIRLILLRWLQSKSFKSANGVIFLTNYAKKQVYKVTGELPGLSAVIPHGFSSRFCKKPKVQLDIGEYSLKNPFRMLYVSIVDQYKHQWNVVEAVVKLKKEGYPVSLDLVGPSYLPALKRLSKTISELDENNECVRYHGSVPYLELHHIYKESNLGIFASSCENMPNILLETMASGLPIVCSDRGPMPEVLGDAGVYFDPESSIEIYSAIKRMIDSPKIRSKKSQASFYRVQQYSWDVCASRTFSFLEMVVKNHKKA